MTESDRKKNMSDHRKCAREDVVFYLRLFDETSNRVLGHLADISVQGLMLISDEPIQVNKAYQLRLAVPEELSEKQEVLFEATSRWCRPDKTPDLYISGFTINEPSEEVQNCIFRLVKEFGFRAASC